MSRFNVLLVESLIFLARVNTELLSTSLPTLRLVAKVARESALPALVVAACVTNANPFVADATTTAVLNGAPTALLVLQMVASQFWAYAAVVLVLSYVHQHLLHEAQVLVLSFVVRAHNVDRRSVLLHVAYTASALLAILSEDAPTRRGVLTVLTIELASWATERHMLPWTVASQDMGLVVNLAFFLCSLCTGVHFLDAHEEADRLYWRPGRHNVIVGVAVYGDRAYLRYRCGPIGGLLSYLEGLSVLPMRIVACDEGDAPHMSFCVSVFCFENLSVLRVHEWPKRDDHVLVCATGRFPYRRILQGLILRMQE